MQGFLVGLAIALFLIVFEYLTLKKVVQERAALKHQKPEFDPSEKRRIRAVVNFCLFVPPGFAFAFWLLD